MSLWWLQPGWKDATCCGCGRNIWDAGGDPDHVLCPDCWDERYKLVEPPQPGPLCDICGKSEAVAASAGLNVCSQECSDEALKRAHPDKETTGA
jgi:hypothetical protein